MRGKGICYDTGFLNAGSSTHEPFDPDRVASDLRAIREELHCTAVRITGGDVERLKLAATHAASAGLEIWLCPFTNNLTNDALLAVLEECADHAESLRRSGAEVVLLTGSELSLMNQGMIPGETFVDRSKALASRDPSIFAALPERMNAFLAEAVARVRARFGGKLSYASLPFEGVDWTPFDYLATDTGYRWAEIADCFPGLVRAFVEQGKALGKPVAFTEFGCATYRGASAVRPAGSDAVVWSEETGEPLRLTGPYVRDEAEQARCIRETLEVFETEGVDSAFAHVFAWYVFPHDPNDPTLDLDVAGSGLVKVTKDGTWKPKEAFQALAEHYR